MEIELKKWGNSLGLRIPYKVAESFGVEENSVIELTESDNALIITKKRKVSNLDELLASIPPNFAYPDDVLDFVESETEGRELI
ncbi:AbrB/MazE/SpoVT family DNA-binding domain-containing protein [Crocosphaera sp.]|uniref:AbrB/MazE/SpoVT family DNA-binding domain-containing protein n=1 Tax=Crocosphaera sp. TaxID=2729996 RepID=UPI002639BB59|nr:AbrB/MazE/SpoVT family DNA-binding domain-containing protein [Crocosphaera sp.]MDJ0580266.1 AbrB/MazE/SpoVT family DNA-binding domain-containing protein [Crocosphaera sp.]